MCLLLAVIFTLFFAGIALAIAEGRNELNDSKSPKRGDSA